MMRTVLLLVAPDKEPFERHQVDELHLQQIKSLAPLLGESNSEPIPLDVNCGAREEARVMKAGSSLMVWVQRKSSVQNLLSDMYDFRALVMLADKLNAPLLLEEMSMWYCGTMITVEMLHRFLGECDWRIQIRCPSCKQLETVTRAAVFSGFNGTEPPYHRQRSWQYPHDTSQRDEEGRIEKRLYCDQNFFIQRNAKCRCGTPINVEARPEFNGLMDYVNQLRIAAYEDGIPYVDADDLIEWKVEGTTHPLEDMLFAAKYNLRTITNALEGVTCHFYRSYEGYMHHFYKKLHALNPSIASQWSLAFYRMKSTDPSMDTDTEAE